MNAELAQLYTKDQADRAAILDAVDAEGVWTLEPVDGSVDDAERARWGVPPLGEQQALASRRSRSR